MERQRRALVVDDDVDITTVFAEVLADCGVSAVATDHRGLPQDDGFCLVITDLEKCFAYTRDSAVNWVAQLHERYRAPVIVVTGHSEALADESLALVAADVMVKPVDVDDFLVRVSRVLAT